jgi:preprotein translocase subunit SecF
MQNISPKIKYFVLVIVVVLAIVLSFVLYKNNKIKNDVPENTKIENTIPEDSTQTKEKTSVQNIPVTAPTTKNTTTPKKTNTAVTTQTKATPVLIDLFSKYKDGSIEECSYGEQLAYKASVNVKDGGAVIYNYLGYGIGWVSGNTPDKVASAVSGCKDVYVVANNVWGKNAVNIYNLK